MRILHTIGRALRPTQLDIARRQHTEGWHVVVASPDPAVRAAAEGLTAACMTTGASRLDRPSFVIRGLVRQHVIQVVHAHDEAAGIAALHCVDLCPIVRSLEADEVAALAADATPLLYDHVLVATPALREQLVAADLIEREHVTVVAPGEVALGAVAAAYETAILRSLTGRPIPARFVGGQPDLAGLARRQQAAE